MEMLLNAYKNTIKSKARFFDMLGCAIWFFVCLAVAERTGFAVHYWFLGFAVWIIFVHNVFYNPQFLLRKMRKAIKEDSTAEFENTIQQEITAGNVVQYTNSNLYLWVTHTWFIFLSNHGSIILKKARITAMYSELTTNARYSLVIEYGADSIFTATCGTDSDEVVQLVDFAKKDGEC